MKKLFALVLALAMTLSLAACGGSSSSSGTAEAPAADGSAAAAETTAAPAGDSTHIYIFTASEDHGWTGSVATFAKEKAEEVNAAGTYTAEVITASDAADQITKLEDVVASGEENIAIVIQPMDDTVQSAIQQAVDAGIPYVAFDRIIDAVAPSAVSNVKGDNEGIGAGSAAYFVSLGMKPGDKVYVYEGDTSSVTTLRDQGFTKYLTGELEFDGALIDDANKWTEDDLNNITCSGAMNWSRSTTKESFESLMGDNSNADIKWIYAEDDELSMGVFGTLPVHGGTVEAFGHSVPLNSIHKAMKAKIAMLANNRKENSVVADMNLLENMYLAEHTLSTAKFHIKKQEEQGKFDRYKQLLNIKAQSSADGITSLSGGNQQKVFLAHWLNTQAEILLLDNPTQGIDVGAKEEIYALILELAKGGKTILINTLEIPEIQKVADYCAVFYEGTVVKLLPHDEIDEKTVMLYSTGSGTQEEEAV